MNAASESLMIWVYAIHLVLSISLTVWVGRTLFQNGRVFLLDAFRGRETLADSVNQLLLVGFYLVNVGFVALNLKQWGDVVTIREVVEAVATKVGGVMLLLGFMHFLNLFVFSRIRRRTTIREEPPPVGSHERIHLQPIAQSV